MRILLVNQFYWPDVAATAQQLQDLAEHLAARGHVVDVLCADTSYGDAGAGRLPRREEHRGVGIHRLLGLRAIRRRRVLRALDSALFHAQAAAWLLLRGSHDVVVTLSDPPLLAAVSALVGALGRRRSRRVAWSMDLYVDASLALGVVRPRSLAARALAGLDAWSLRRADLVVALGECMARRLAAKGVPSERLRVIPPWSPELPRDRRAVEQMRSELGLERAFVVLYSGNAGSAHDFRSTCEAMKRLRGDPGIEFVFIGGGARSDEVEACAREAGARFRRLPYFPRERTPESLALGDVHLVTLRDDMCGVVVPSKLAGILAAGRPVVYVGPRDSSLARQVREAGAGHVVATDDPGGLVAALRQLANLPARRHAMGARAREYFREHLAQGPCCARWEDALSAVARR